jgi:FSR family fosmidomycin resistance protein-like MFS transporter
VPQHSASRRRVSTTLVLALLAVELIDELVFGVRNAAWPMMRADLQLTYEQIGVLLSLPTIVGGLIEPAIGILGDTPRRRALLIGGGVVFTCSVAATALVDGWIALLMAFAAFNPASGAFVGLSEATLMDLQPERREQNMARWVVAGSLGVAGGTSLVTVLAHFNGTWRHAFIALGVLSAAALLAVIRAKAAAPQPHAATSGPLAPDLRAGAVEALRALARSDVRRWLILLESSNMMMDVLGSFLALYVVDVAGGTAVQAAAGVALFTGVGLAGDALLIPLLERMDGIRYLRASVMLSLVAYPALLIVPSIPAKFAVIGVLAVINSGWYSIPQARLYDAMPNQSGTVMTLANTFGLIAALVPLALGAIAQRVGLEPTMWLLLIGPLALLVGLPRARVLPKIAREG